MSRDLSDTAVVTNDMELVCGPRRLEAVKRLGWAEIEVRVISPDNLLSAERDENEGRKDFTPSERVAIARAIEARLGKRQGSRTDLESSSLPHNCAEVDPGKESREVAAKVAGF